jgi:predicted ribosomally synthesized peptide with nif11-like leader
MSKADIIQFTKDVRDDATLAAQFKQAGVTDMTSAVQFAQDKGYDFTLDEVKLHAAEQLGTQTLSDTKMDALLGASWVYSGPTATVEAVAAQTTVAAQAEVAVEEAAAAATTVLAAAEVVIVVT